MTKLLLMLSMLSLFSVIGCGKSGSGAGSADSQELAMDGQDVVESVDVATGTEGTDQNETPPSSISPTTNVPALALSLKSNLNLMGFSTAQKTKYNKAIAMVKKVVATEAFRTKVLNFKYNGTKQFANNNGKTNSQIYQSILEAAEKLKPAKNNTVDMGVKLYYQDSSVVGYTNPSITYINVNTKFFNTFAVNQVAGNLFHEWLHKLGYGHDASVTAKRPYSVPYAIGYMIRDLGKSFL